MSLSERQIHNLFEIAKIIHMDPEPQDLCALLATRVCPEGELVRVYLAKLYQDGIFRTLSAFGYSSDSKILEFQTGLDKKIPLVDAYLRAEVLLLDKEDLSIKYPNFRLIDSHSPLEALVITPTLTGGLVFVFRLQVRLSQNYSEKLYFEAIATLLSFYREECSKPGMQIAGQINLEFSKKSPQLEELKNRPLTGRQRTILAHIQEGLTNSQIAREIGYSESLVRQESILIYAKMGVRGRVDLRAKETLLRISR